MVRKTTPLSLWQSFLTNTITDLKDSQYLLRENRQALPNFFFFIQFNVPFKIISLIETSQSIGGTKRENPGKTT